MRRGRKKVVVITTDNAYGPCKTANNMKVDDIIFHKITSYPTRLELSSKKKEKYSILIGNGMIFVLHILSSLDPYAFVDVYQALYVMIALCTEIPGNQILLRFESFILENLCGKSFPILVLDDPEVFKNYLPVHSLAFTAAFLSSAREISLGTFSSPPSTMLDFELRMLFG